MISAKVHRVSMPSPRNSTKFCVNSDWEHPTTLTQAILQAKVECFDDLCANRPAQVAICSIVTGEVLFIVRLNRDLSYKIDGFVYINDANGNLLRAEVGVEDAISWIQENGYRILKATCNRLIVTDASLWFMK